MDRSHTVRKATVQLQARRRELGQFFRDRARSDGPGGQRTDIPGAIESWGGLHCASQVRVSHSVAAVILTAFSNVVAYTASATPPLPFRFKSSNVRLQVPDLGFGSLAQNVKFFRVMSQTATWRTLSTVYHTLKTWLRRSIWGDRVCCH
jgi:hypothetical protein